MWLINAYTKWMPAHTYEFLLKLQDYSLLVYLELSPQNDNPYFAIRVINELSKTVPYESATESQIQKFLSLVNEDNLNRCVVKTIFSESFYYES